MKKPRRKEVEAKFNSIGKLSTRQRKTIISRNKFLLRYPLTTDPEVLSKPYYQMTFDNFISVFSSSPLLGQLKTQRGKKHLIKQTWINEVIRAVRDKVEGIPIDVLNEFRFRSPYDRAVKDYLKHFGIKD